MDTHSYSFNFSSTYSAFTSHDRSRCDESSGNVLRDPPALLQLPTSFPPGLQIPQPAPLDAVEGEVHMPTPFLPEIDLDNFSSYSHFLDPALLSGVMNDVPLQRPLLHDATTHTNPPHAHQAPIPDLSSSPVPFISPTLPPATRQDNQTSVAVASDAPLSSITLAYGTPQENTTSATAGMSVPAPRPSLSPASAGDQSGSTHLPHQNHVSAMLLSEANNSSWASRNPGQPVIPRHTLSAAERERANELAATRRASAGSRKDKETALNDAIKQLINHISTTVEAIAAEHDVTPEKVQKLLGGYQHYKSTRKSQLTNALLHAKAVEVNSALPRGQKLRLKEIRDLVKEDPAMQDLTEDEKQKYLEMLNEHRALQEVGVRATNAAQAKDVQATLDRVFSELDNLAKRTGVYSCVFVTRGHVFDSSQATWFGTDNVMDFWEDVMLLEPDVITRKLEQWACTFGQNLEERDSLPHLQRAAARLINSGLRVATKQHSIRMNFVNYEVAMKSKHSVNIVGWPKQVPFKSPFSISNAEHVRALRDALKAGECHWVRMSAQQQRQHAEELQARRDAGEVVGKKRKQRSDAGTTRKSNQPARQKKQPAKKRRKVAKSVPYVDDDSGGEASGEEN